MNRPGIAAFDHFGSDEYAREELVAQMSSSILCAQTGIEAPEIFDNSASYIAGWLSALNHDTRLVVNAAAQAQRACDVINQAEREPAKNSDRRPEVAPAGNEHASAQAMAVTAGPLQTSHRLGGQFAAAYDRGELAEQQRAAGAAPSPADSQVPAPLAAGADAARQRGGDETGAGHHTHRRLAGRGRLRKGRTP